MIISTRSPENYHTAGANSSLWLKVGIPALLVIAVAALLLEAPHSGISPAGNYTLQHNPRAHVKENPASCEAGSGSAIQFSLHLDYGRV
jgi:hypothetical protein